MTAKPSMLDVHVTLGGTLKSYKSVNSSWIDRNAGLSTRKLFSASMSFIYMYF